ncbi:MAG: heavy-metal-associated domain-containing protein [Sporichthyaceae bacterium]
MTIEFAVTGMHCASCGLLIDDAVEELPGVVRAHTDVRRERTVVELDGTGASVEQVLAVIAAEGYGASVVAGD